MKKFISLTILMFSICATVSLALFAIPGYAQPVITSFTPTAGPAGTIVTISGSGFSDNLKRNVVYFGAVKAPLLTASSSALTVKVPTGATYKPITVTTIGGTAYSNAPFTVTFGTDTIRNGSFTGKLDVTSGNYVFALTNADIDGDKKTDILAANYSDSTLSIFRNISTTGALAFAPKITIKGLPAPGDIFTGDVDGDGQLDMMVIYVNVKTLSVYRNTSTKGIISFAERVDYTTGTYPIFGAIGDLNADGKPDIVIANNQTSSVSVFQNSSVPGTISLTLKKDFKTESGPEDVVIRDLDGDAKPDLAVTNYFSNSVSILKNKGTGDTIAFAQMKNFPVGLHPYHMAVGDLNGDGEPDLAVANTFGNSISVLKNSKGNKIAFDPKQDFPMPNNVESVNIGDLNGDGKPDMAVAGSDISVAVLQNISNKDSIVFLDNQYFYLGGSSSYVAIGDEDGDAQPELIVGYFEKVAILRNQMSSSLAANSNSFTGINREQLNLVDLKISPNPVKDYMLVQYVAHAAPAQLILADANGRIIKAVQVLPYSSETKIYVTGLAAGTYILTWTDGKNKISSAVMIQ
jgi:hypothetical protein